MGEPNVVKAVELLGRHSRGFFVIWELAGPHLKRVRAEIMAELVGRKVPVAKCGVNALCEAFYAIAKPAGECLAERERAFEAWCAELLAGAEREREASIAYQGPG